MKEGLVNHEGIVSKVLQLYETIDVRHGNMLVGDPCSGKSTVWRILSKSLTALSEQKTEKGSQVWQPVEVHVINPKAIDVNGHLAICRLP